MRRAVICFAVVVTSLLPQALFSLLLPLIHLTLFPTTASAECSGSSQVLGSDSGCALVFSV